MDSTRTTVINIPTGPFDEIPLGLGWAVSDGFTEAVTGNEIRTRVRVWLTEILARSGVTLGASDHEAIELIVEDGWPTAQIVAGWIIRAQDAPDA